MMKISTKECGQLYSTYPKGTDSKLKEVCLQSSRSEVRLKFALEGIKPDDDKITAMLEMPELENKKDLLRFLGMVTFCSQFIPQMASITEPLRELLTADTMRHWEVRHKRVSREDGAITNRGTGSQVLRC